MDATVGRFNYGCPVVNTWVQTGWADPPLLLAIFPIAAQAGPVRLGWSLMHHQRVAAIPNYWAPRRSDNRSAMDSAIYPMVKSLVRQRQTQSSPWIAILTVFPYSTTVSVDVTIASSNPLGDCKLSFPHRSTIRNPATTLTFTPTTCLFPQHAGSLPSSKVSMRHFPRAAVPAWDADCLQLPSIAGTNISFTRTNGLIFAATSTAATSFQRYHQRNDIIMTAAMAAAGCAS